MIDVGKISAWIGECLPPGAHFAPDKTVGDAGLDSLRLSQMILTLEEKLDVVFEDHEIEMIFTAGTLGEILEEIEQSVKTGSLARRYAA